MNDCEKMNQNIFNSMVTAIKREVTEGRHPHVKIGWYSKGTKTTKIMITSEQISESLELRPSELEAFKKILQKNGIAIE